MPIYDLKCRHPKCGRNFDKTFNLALYEALQAKGFNGVHCPHCGQNAPTVVIHAPMIDCGKSITLDPNAVNTPPELAGQTFTSNRAIERAKDKLGIIHAGGGPNPLRKGVGKRIWSVKPDGSKTWKLVETTL